MAGQIDIDVLEIVNAGATHRYPVVRHTVKTLVRTPIPYLTRWTTPWIRKNGGGGKTEQGAVRCGG
jgi:hypothetical protein